MTKMHEILGVAPDEVFTFAYGGLNRKYRCDLSGAMYRADCTDSCAYPSPTEFAVIINNANRIIRKPRLTDKQIQLLYAGHLLGFRYLAKDDTGEMMMYVNKPHKSGSYWMYNLPMDKCAELDSNSPLSGLVQWDDAEPLDVLKILKDNNVEV